MIGRRLTYGALLLGAIALYIFYGQYVSLCILLFVSALPLISVLLSLPAILKSHAELKGGTDVQRGRPSKVRLCVDCGFFLPPDVWKVKIEYRNLFLDPRPKRRKVRIYGTKSHEEIFVPDTERLGTISYRIRSARVCDYLGLIAIPIKKSGVVALTVMPNPERPVPMPELTESSDRILTPKPIGFSEEHELRPYREGDAVNLIHWKLTEKMDAPIVREPQEQARKNIVLSMDLYDDYDAQQSVLEQLRCLADVLNENKIPFMLRYGLRNAMIDGQGDFERFLRSFLSEPGKTEAAQPVASGSDTLVYRILPRKEVRP